MTDVGMRRSAHRSGSRIMLAATVAAASLAPANTAVAQRYNVVEYEYPHGYWIINVNALNNRGQMVGTGHFSSGSSNRQTALLWHADGRVVELPYLLPFFAHRYFRDSRGAEAFDINDHGVVVGRSAGLIYGNRAVVWPDEHTIVDLLEANTSVARDINDASSVVGSANGTFLWRNGEVLSLSPMRSVHDINNLDQVVGNDFPTALFYDKREFIPLPPLRPGAAAEAHLINDLGLIGGWSQRDTDLFHPVVWESGRVRELPRLRPDTTGSVSSMNIRGERTGSTYYPNLRPVYYRNNLVMELNDLVLESIRSHWRIDIGTKLNDAGQIGGRAWHFLTGHLLPVRLDPVDTGLTLWGIEPSRPGVRNVIQINHATPGGRVSLLWGTTRGEPQPLQQCPGAMIDIIDPRLAATALAGPDGRAIIRIQIPAHIDGTYMLQAVDHSTCEVSPPAWAIIQEEN